MSHLSDKNNNFAWCCTKTKCPLFPFHSCDSTLNVTRFINYYRMLMGCHFKFGNNLIMTNVFGRPEGLGLSKWVLKYSLGELLHLQYYCAITHKCHRQQLLLIFWLKLSQKENLCNGTLPERRSRRRPLQHRAAYKWLEVRGSKVWSHQPNRLAKRSGPTGCAS